jgi:DNA-directed RNA polymerase specialized sigma24 family protein
MDQQIIAERFISSEERTRLLHFCTKITGNPDTAEDMVQETLVEAERHPHRCLRLRNIPHPSYRGD